MQRLDRLFRALKHRNYRLYFSGQIISLVGTWMQTVALSWLVYRLTGSAMLLGVVGFVSQIPSFLLAPFTGVVADRFNRHRIIICTQTLAMLQAFILSMLVLSGRIEIWHIIALSALLGIVNAFDMPARQSFVIEIVERKEDLANAIALNSSIFNSARLIGPSAAGILIAAFGEGLCFLLNALSYLAVIAALLAMKINRKPAAADGRKKAGSGFKEGLSYTFGFTPIRYILMLLALGSLLGMPYTVLMPVFVKGVLKGGPRTLGFLFACSGAGALCAALRLAWRKHVPGLERKIPVFSGLFGAGLIAFSFSRVLAVSAVCIAAASFGLISQMASSNTVIQTVVEDDKRGRVMALYSLAFMGMAPFGSLLAGWMASRIGAPWTIFLSGAAVICGAMVFRSKIGEISGRAHHVYRDLGLLDSEAAVLGDAEGLERTAL
ncbi:MAG: MFS transporter [Elusimicrobia bacterium]|nr:MFS transporter [Elusimicrobiota bacterium]